MKKTGRDQSVPLTVIDEHLREHNVELILVQSAVDKA